MINPNYSKSQGNYSILLTNLQLVTWLCSSSVSNLEILVIDVFLLLDLVVIAVPVEFFDFDFYIKMLLVLFEFKSKVLQLRSEYASMLMMFLLICSSDMLVRIADFCSESPRVESDDFFNL